MSWRLFPVVGLMACSTAAPTLKLSDASGAAGTVVVETEVESVDLPAVDSPSLVGERATATLRVSRGAVPGASSAKRVRLQFDSQGARRFVVGQPVALHFTSSGALAEVR